MILQAINNYSFKGVLLEERAELEKQGILQRVREEQAFVDGIETVYRALLQMQTIVALGIQADRGTKQMEQTEAIEETR